MVPVTGFMDHWQDDPRPGRGTFKLRCALPVTPAVPLPVADQSTHWLAVLPHDAVAAKSDKSDAMAWIAHSFMLQLTLDSSPATKMFLAPLPLAVALLVPVVVVGLQLVGVGALASQAVISVGVMQSSNVSLRCFRTSVIDERQIKFRRD